MITRLKTSRESKEILENLNRALRFSNNAILLRIAIARSINEECSIEEDHISIVNNTSGFEITRNTLYGDNEIVFKALMHVTDPNKDEYFFPYLTNRHIERGLKLLERDYKMAGNKEKFLINIIKNI